MAYILSDRANKDRIPVISIQTDFMEESELEEALKNEYGIVIRSGLHDAEEAHKTLGTYPRGTARFSFNYLIRKRMLKN